MSISNKQKEKTIIAGLYPVLYHKEVDKIIASSIEGYNFEGIILPQILNPGEVRMVKIFFSIDREILFATAGAIKDSSHITSWENGPPQDQRQGTLGLGWQVVDADGENFRQMMKIIHYNISPTPPDFPDPETMDHWWIISEKPFEMCEQETILIK